MELRPLKDAQHQELLLSLQRQDDVWEFVGTLPIVDGGQHHLFAIMDGELSLGFAGLVKSPTPDGNDFELLCAIRSEVQQRGIAKRACQLVLTWAFDTAKFERVLACIDDSNEAARAIAIKLGMTELAARPPARTVYVKYRDARSQTA